ncbi:MAG: shikimate kinase [Shimia sp.]
MDPSGTLRKTVVMVGMMGAGKTAVGRALARRLDVPFADSDEALEDAANMTIPEIFARDGEAFFRDKERQVIARLMEGPPCILSVGGGAFLAPQTRAAIDARGVSVWLEADLEVLWERVRRRDTRPLLRTDDPKATLARLLAERSPIYAEAGLHVTSEAGASIEEMAERVARALATRPDVLEAPTHV